jgi:hypothetical protein
MQGRLAQFHKTMMNGSGVGRQLLNWISVLGEQIRQEHHAPRVLVAFEHALPHLGDDVDRVEACQFPARTSSTDRPESHSAKSVSLGRAASTISSRTIGWSSTPP